MTLQSAQRDKQKPPAKAWPLIAATVCIGKVRILSIKV